MFWLGSRRTAKAKARWHEHVTIVADTAPYAQSVHLDYSPDILFECSRHYQSPFPYAQLQVITQAFLGKKKWSASQQDELLIELILDHDRREVAFAACVKHLSTAAVLHLLHDAFDIHDNASDDLKSYLRAFIAAAEWKEDLGWTKDGSFAEQMITTLQEGFIPGDWPRAVELLIELWRLDTPTSKVLLARARALTKCILQWVDNDLANFKSQLASRTIQWTLCSRVLEYNSVFAANIEIDETIASCISCYQGWARWEPNRSRLKQWASVPHGTTFNCLVELDGPDLRSGQSQHGSECEALLHEKTILRWLGTKGFKLAADLATGNSDTLITAFVHSFIDTALAALQNKNTVLLQHLIEKEALDSHTLKSFRLAQNLLPDQFVALMLKSDGPVSEDVDTTVVQGLRTLSKDFSNAVRKPLRDDIALFATKAIAHLALRVSIAFDTGEYWADPAIRLWALRSSVANAGWLHSALASTIVTTCMSQATQHSLNTLQRLQIALDYETDAYGLTLRSDLKVYARSFVLSGCATAEDNTTISRVLHRTWEQVQRQSVRDATILIAGLEGMCTAQRVSCIRNLSLGTEEAVQRLRKCFQDFNRGDCSGTVHFVTVILSLRDASGHDPCWQALFLFVAKKVQIRLDNAQFTSLGYLQYRQVLEALYEFVEDDIELLKSTHCWLQELRLVQSVIITLEAEKDSHLAMHYVLSEQRLEVRQRYLNMLQVFMVQADIMKKLMMQELILTLRTTNSQKVCEAVSSIAMVGSDGFAQCDKFLMLCRQDKNVASARLAIWSYMGRLDDKTKTALTALGRVMNLGLDHNNHLSSACFEPAQKDYAKRVAELIARAQQLERARMSLKRSDPGGVRALVSELGLEPTPAFTGVRSLVSTLPLGLSNLIVDVSEDEIQLTFPLSKELNAMEHLAFGLQGNETLRVQLRLDHQNKFGALCVHVYSKLDVPITNHTCYQDPKNAPDRLHCSNQRLTRLTYAVARSIWRSTQVQGETSLPIIHDTVRNLLQTGASRCIVCGGYVGGKRHRATICTSPRCKQAYLRTPLDLRLEDVRTNSRVFDLLLASVFGAANVKNLGLLPNCPATLNDTAKLQILLNSLPTTAALAAANDFTTGLVGCGQRAELLLSWLCTSFRGFIVPATGQYKLPSMGNIHQFLVVDNPPDIQAAFAEHDHFTQRHVLFHGTSMDRLYAILTQGLKICSSTPLQKHGAASGAGIYTARDPKTCVGYATRTQTNRNFNGFFNSRTDFRDTSVLLGLEHAGNDTSGTSIHVIKDTTRILVRYIFLLPPGTNVPRAQDIVPAMLRVFGTLRATAAARVP